MWAGRTARLPHARDDLACGDALSELDEDLVGVGVADGEAAALDGHVVAQASAGADMDDGARGYRADDRPTGSGDVEAVVELALAGEGVRAKSVWACDLSLDGAGREQLKCENGGQQQAPRLGQERLRIHCLPAGSRSMPRPMGVLLFSHLVEVVGVVGVARSRRIRSWRQTSHRQTTLPKDPSIQGRHRH